MTKAMLIIIITFVLGMFAKVTGQLDKEPMVNFQWLIWVAFALGVFNLIQSFWINQQQKKSSKE